MVIETKVVIGWFKPHLKCDWLIELSDNKLSDNKVSDNKLSDNSLTSELVGNRSFFKPITIEEIVIFMISWKIFASENELTGGHVAPESLIHWNRTYAKIFLKLCQLIVYILGT